MSPLQQRMAQLKAQREENRVAQEDHILYLATLPNAGAHEQQVAQQILDRRNSPK